MKRVKSQQIPYSTPTIVVIPQRPHWLGLVSQIDPHGGNIKPRIVWEEEPAYPQRKEQTVILFRGDADVEYPNYKNFKFLFVTHDQNRRGGGIATLWACDPEIAPAKPTPTPKPKKQPQLPSPDSLAAIADHEKKMKIKAAQEKALKESEESEAARAVVEAKNKWLASLEKKEEENLLDTLPAVDNPEFLKQAEEVDASREKAPK